MFDRLQKNVEKNCIRLDQLDVRVESAAKKVELLRDSKKVKSFSNIRKYIRSIYENGYFIGFYLLTAIN